MTESGLVIGPQPLIQGRLRLGFKCGRAQFDEHAEVVRGPYALGIGLAEEDRGAEGGERAALEEHVIDAFGRDEILRVQRAAGDCVGPWVPVSDAVAQAAEEAQLAKRVAEIEALRREMGG